MKYDPEQLDSNALLKNALLEMRKMRSDLEALEQAQTEPIAIIGIGCRFPKGVNNPDDFWQLLENKVDAVTEIPSDRWDADAYYDPDPDAPGKMYTQQAAFLDQVDKFDPQFFGISPREAISMDPQQRLLLEVSWEALENANQAPEQLDGSQTGVFVGVISDEYAQLGRNSSDFSSINAYSSLGVARSVAVGRVSYVLGLQGPNLHMDTACSSSLLAIHLACQSLRLKESNLALAGGVNLMLTPATTIENCKLKALAKDGRSKTFDDSADGYGRGEGCGIVVLKRLSDAVANGDNILAVIRGSAVNHDGRSNGLTAPNGVAQKALLQQTLKNAKLQPKQIQYVEVHGTGTSLGDPIEVLSLGSVLGEGRPHDQPLLIGSVKTNIGHLEAAAGVAGLIKVVLALQHGKIPSHLHLKQPNRYIPWEKLPVKIPTELMPWPTPGEEGRLAGVSAFSLSGTNVHIILGSAPEVQPIQEIPLERPMHLLGLSAKSEEALRDLAHRYAVFLKSHLNATLADICFTANVGRSHFPYRLAVSAKSTAQLQEKLEAIASNQQTTSWVQGQAQNRKHSQIAFLFTGQGSQYVGMGHQFYNTQPTFRQALEDCDKILRSYLEKPLLEVLYPADGNSTLLNQTAYTQPALFALEYALAQLWISWGVEPAVVMGHSAGEYAAACIAGVFSLEDGLKLIAVRARLMQALPPNGQMVAVFTSETQVAAIIEKYGEAVAIAAINGPKSIVISGNSKAVETIVAKLQSQGIQTKPLNVSHAFHSPLIEPMLNVFEQVARSITYSTPSINLISNLTGELIQAEIATPEYWCHHVRQPVRFSAGMETLYQQNYQLFLEIGSKPTLVSMGRYCLPENVGIWLSSLRPGYPDWQAILQTLGELYIQGVAVNWSGFDLGYPRRYLQLPTYPFQRQRYWLEENALNKVKVISSSDQSSHQNLHPLLHQQLYLADSKEIRFESHLSVDSTTFVDDHRIFQTTILPATAYLEMALAAGAKILKTSDLALEEVLIQQALILPKKESKTVQLVLNPEKGSAYTFQIFSLTSDTGSAFNWVLHASGKVLLDQRVTQLPKIDLEALLGKYKQVVSVTNFYSQFQKRGIDYGQTFQAIEHLWLNGKEVLSQIQLSESLVLDAGKFELHPVLLDACFQTLAAALPQESQQDTYLPVSVDRLQIHRQPGTRLWCHTQIRLFADANQSMIADLQLFNQTGALVAQLEGLSVRRADRQTLLRSLETELNDLTYEITWKAKSLNASLHKYNQALNHWLIFTDSGEIADKIADELENRGDRCVLVSASQSYEQKTANHYLINPANPSDYTRLLQDSVAANQPPFCGVIHFWSLELRSQPAISGTALLDAQVLSCGSILHLVQALTQIGTEPPRLWLVTQGAQAVEQNPISVEVQQAAVWGLGRVIALEHPEFSCTHLDLDPAGAINNIPALVDELFITPQSPNFEDQVSWRQGQRYVARLVRCVVQPRQFQPLFNQKSCYLITGGLGALGLRVAHWMVEQGARHLVITSRHDVTSETQAAVAQLEQAGTQVKIIKANVSNSADVASIFKEVKATLPPLRGIIHAAGVLKDGILLQQTWEQFSQVLAPKVVGAWNLHTLSQSIELDFFVCFSSVASILGSPGQGNYAAANAFMDGLAHHRRVLGLPALSINWGPWAENGMAVGLSDRDLDRLKNQGLGTIPPEQSLKILENLWQQNTSQVSVVPINWSQFLQQFAQGIELPLLEEFKQADNQPSNQRPQLLQRLDKTPIHERLPLLLFEVSALVSKLLGLDISQQPQYLEQGFFELGMDSLMSVELRNQLRTSLGCSLPSTLVFKYPTIQALVNYLAQELIPLEFVSEIKEPSQKLVDDTNELVAELEALSQDEIFNLLAKELGVMETD